MCLKHRTARRVILWMRRDSQPDLIDTMRNISVLNIHVSTAPHIWALYIRNYKEIGIFVRKETAANRNLRRGEAEYRLFFIWPSSRLWSSYPPHHPYGQHLKQQNSQFDPVGTVSRTLLIKCLQSIQERPPHHSYYDYLEHKMLRYVIPWIRLDPQSNLFDRCNVYKQCSIHSGVHLTRPMIASRNIKDIGTIVGKWNHHWLFYSNRSR